MTTTIREFIDNFRENTGRLPSQVELSKQLKLSATDAVKILLQYSKEPPKHVKALRKFSKVTALRVVLIMVSLFTFILSIYFTGLWFKSMFNIFIAGLISVSMVSYMVISPQVTPYIKGIVKIPLWATFMIALLFSMGSTVAGQYNKITDGVDVTSVNDRTTYSILLREEHEKVQKILDLKEEKKFHEKTLQSLASNAEDRKGNSAYIRTERNKVAEYNDFIEEEENRLLEIRSNIKEELKKGTVAVTEERKDFYSWVADLLGMDKNIVEFWIAVLPAVFIDIISALCLNLALFIGEKKHENV